MKKRFHSFFLPFMVLVVVGCSDEKEDNVPPSPIVGFWVGEHTMSVTSGAPDSYYYAVLFRKNGTVREYRGDPISGGIDTTTSKKSQGTYSFSHPEVSYTTTRIGSTEETSSAGTILDLNKTHIEGSWGFGTSTTNAGSFVVNKQ